MNQTIVPITIPVTPYPKPIHYFKIEQSSFEGSCFWQPQAEDAESLIHVNDIELAAGEYLSLDTNLAELNRKLTDTTVFNFQVGKGKTRLLHECMLGYLNEPDKYVVFYCAPFKRLLEQNEREIKERASAKGILVSVHDCTQNSSELTEGERYGFTDDGTSANIYLMTPEFLMGSGGKRYQRQSFKRADFKQRLLDNLERNNKQIILCLDEIHEKTDMYRSTRLAHLYRIKPERVYKIFVASATFTRESVEVVKAVSMLTGRKITVFQANRIKEPVQSDLFLHICTDKYSLDSLESLESGLQRVLKASLEKNHRVHILTAQKQLARAIKDSKGKLSEVITQLKPRLLTGEQKAVFDETKHSLGTTITTGINIESSASTLVLILPGSIPAGDTGTMDYSYAYGIFSSGLVSLVQSLARLRNGGEIHVFMPPFVNYIQSEDHRTNTTAKDIIEQVCQRSFEQPRKSEQELLDELVETYDSERKAYEAFVSGIFNKRRDLYDEHKKYFGFESRYDFILSEYAAYRMAKSYSEGKQLFPLLLWLGLNDQLTNCSLRSVTIEYYESDTIKLSDTTNLTNLLQKLVSERKPEHTSENIFESVDQVLKALLYSNEIPDKQVVYSCGKWKGNINTLFSDSKAVTKSVFEVAGREAASEKLSPLKQFYKLVEAAQSESNIIGSGSQFHALAIAVDQCRRELMENARGKGRKRYIADDLTAMLSPLSYKKVETALQKLQQDPLVKAKIATLPGSNSNQGITKKNVEQVIAKGFADDAKKYTLDSVSGEKWYRKLL